REEDRDHADDEVAEAGPCRKADRTHGGNHGEKRIGVRAVLIDVVEQLAGDELQCLIPAHSLPLSAAALNWTSCTEALANEWILEPLGAVDIFNEAGPFLAAARIVVRQIAVDARIVGGLLLTDHDPILDVDHPRATPRAVGP